MAQEQESKLPVIKKPAGLGSKKRPAAEEDQKDHAETVFVLPDTEESKASDQNVDDGDDLEIMFDTLEVAMADEPHPSKSTVLLMRAVIHEADRQSKLYFNNESCTGERYQRVQEILAKSLYYLSLWEHVLDENEPVCAIKVDMLRDAVERLEQLEDSKQLCLEAKLLLKIHDPTYEYSWKPDAEGKWLDPFLDFPPTFAIADFLNTKLIVNEDMHIKHQIIPIMTLLACECSDTICKRNVVKTLSKIIDDAEQELDNLQRAQLFMNRGSILESMDDENCEQDYDEATAILEQINRAALPEWAINFLENNKEDSEENLNVELQEH